MELIQLTRYNPTTGLLLQAIVDANDVPHQSVVITYVEKGMCKYVTELRVSLNDKDMSLEMPESYKNLVKG